MCRIDSRRPCSASLIAHVGNNGSPLSGVVWLPGTAALAHVPNTAHGQHLPGSTADIGVVRFPYVGRALKRTARQMLAIANISLVFLALGERPCGFGLLALENRLNATHGSYLGAKRRLGFLGRKTPHPILSNGAHGHHLPSSRMTLSRSSDAAHAPHLPGVFVALRRRLSWHLLWARSPLSGRGETPGRDLQPGCKLMIGWQPHPQEARAKLVEIAGSVAGSVRLAGWLLPENYSSREEYSAMAKARHGWSSTESAGLAAGHTDLGSTGFPALGNGNAPTYEQIVLT